MAATRRYGPEDVMRLIIEEVDDAREAYKLVTQLAPSLPFRSFDEFKKIGSIRFRGQQHPVEVFRDSLPRFEFPIEDERALVERIADLIAMTPNQGEQDPQDPTAERRRLRRIGVPSMTTAFPTGPQLSSRKPG